MRTPSLPSSVEWIESSHPFPDARSEAAGERALAIARAACTRARRCVVLLSGGASALMALPVDGMTLDDKSDDDAHDDGGRAPTSTR